MRDSASRRIVLLSVACIGIRLVSAIFVSVPGYTDAYYYVDVAARLARGEGLTADFVWNFLEAPALAPLPVASHRFWMPLATIVQAAGIAPLGAFLGEFRAAQAAVLTVAAFVPFLTYRAARVLGGSEWAALLGAALVGLGGLFAPAWVSADSFAIAAVVGTLFFFAFSRAADGSLRAGALAGALTGLLFLARAEAALFGVALLALATRRLSRGSGLAGIVVAVAIGLGWLARGIALGLPNDLLARSALLVRYEDFFAIGSPTFGAFAAALPSVLADKAGALVSNATVVLFAFALVLAPLIGLGAWRLRDRADVRAWWGLMVLIYLVQSLVWTEHSVRGSFFHSIAAFVPFGFALGVVSAERLLAKRTPGEQRLSGAGMLVATAIISAFALIQWDASFGAAHRERVGVLDAIPPGPFLAIDAAAWRWISGRTVIVTPADGIDPWAACAAARYGASSIVLEPAHFRRYDAMYRLEARPAWLGPPVVRGAIEVFPIIGDLGCSISITR